MSDRPNRKSIRLHGYDYAGPGTIFFTYCTADRFDFFGSVIDGVMHENEVGDIAWAEWRKTLEIRKEVIAHAFVVMPNHVHGMISFAPDSNSFIPTPSDFETNPYFERKRPRSLSTMATGFKGAVTRVLRKRSDDPYLQIWQRNYYDHVVRDQMEFETIARYIEENPKRWADDRFNPGNPYKRSISRGKSHDETLFDLDRINCIHARPS